MTFELSDSIKPLITTLRLSYGADQGTILYCFGLLHHPGILQGQLPVRLAEAGVHCHHVIRQPGEGALGAASHRAHLSLPMVRLEKYRVTLIECLLDMGLPSLTVA